jgi:hypothetical protein
MRLRWLTAIGAVSLLIGSGVAGASHVTQLDPATVPTGFFAAHIRINDKPVAELERAARLHSWDVFVQHFRLTPNETTGWHTHPGPAIASVVAGRLTYQDAPDGVCRNRVYNAGTGFVDRGFGWVHRAIAGPHGADVYVTFITPAGTPSQTVPAAPPAACTT